MRLRRFGSLTLALVASFALALACSSGNGGADAADILPSADTDVGEERDAAAEPDVVAEPLNLDFNIAYTLIGRVTENLNESDLWMMRADGTRTESITGFVEASEDGAGLSCHHSCIVDRDLTWIAVATGPPDEQGFFSFEMGRFNAQGEVSMAKTQPLSDVVDLQFARNHLFYTKLLRKTPQGSHQYEVVRVNLNRPAERDTLLVFPPDEVLDDSVYYGHFRVSPDGGRVVFLQPTIRSQSIYVWDVAGGFLQQVDFICPIMINGVCDGSGSDYTDLDPIAISQDGARLAAFVVSGRQFRVHLYDLDDLGRKPYKDLARVGAGEVYEHLACDRKESWQFVGIAGDPVFSPGEEWLYWVGKSECGTDKPETDILRVSVARLEADGDLEQADVQNLTQTPKDGTAEQLVIGRLALSPDATVVAFTATPAIQSNGLPIPEGSSRHRNDEELWVQGVDGRDRTQLTNDTKWRAYAPVALPSDMGGGQ